MKTIGLVFTEEVKPEKEKDTEEEEVKPGKKKS